MYQVQFLIRSNLAVRSRGQCRPGSSVQLVIIKNIKTLTTFLLNQVTQCTGWMHCSVGGCVTAHFTLPFRLNKAMFNNEVRRCFVPRRWRCHSRGQHIVPNQRLHACILPHCSLLSLRRVHFPQCWKNSPILKLAVGKSFFLKRKKERNMLINPKWGKRNWPNKKIK